MAKVLVIHGMGEHAPGWWTGDTGVLSEIKKIKRHDTFKVLGKKPTTLGQLTDLINWSELNYDKECEKLRTAPGDSNKTSDVKAFIKDNNIGRIPGAALDKWSDDASSTIDKLTGGTLPDFIRTHIWDVYLCSLKLTRHYLAIKVAKQIVRKIEEDNDDKISILAISLGTALIQEALQLVHRLLKGNRHPIITVCLLADFSRTLVGDILVSHKSFSANSKMYPSVNGTDSVCKYFISCRHRYDPLSYLAQDVPSSFEPSTPLGENKWSSIPKGANPDRYWVHGHDDLKYIPKKFQSLDFSDVDLFELGAYNHSAVNYLSAPIVHLPFLLTALGINRKTIPDIAMRAQKRFEKDHAFPKFAASLIEANAKDGKLEWMTALTKLFYNFQVDGKPVTGGDVHV